MKIDYSLCVRSLLKTITYPLLDIHWLITVKYLTNFHDKLCLLHDEYLVTDFFVGLIILIQIFEAYFIMPIDMLSTLTCTDCESGGEHNQNGNFDFSKNQVQNVEI